MRALDEEGLTTGDIDYVFLSHRHPDHVLLACLFEKAKYVTFDDHLIYDKDVLLEYDKNVLGDDIERIDTPGHVPEHLSLIVDTDNGKIAVAVFDYVEVKHEVFVLEAFSLLIWCRGPALKCLNL